MNALSANLLLSVSAALFATTIAVATLLRRRPSVAEMCFAGGMIGLALESCFSALGFRATSAQAGEWQHLALLIKSFHPALWLGFSLTYARGNGREFLWKWRYILVAASFLPAIHAFGFRDLIRVLPPTEARPVSWMSFTVAGTALNVLMLAANVLILTNLEGTFRSAIGTAKWRLKYVVLGLGLVFGSRIYTCSQALLFSGYDLTISVIEAGALFIGCLFLIIAYLRRGFAELDLYPSQAVLRSSVTIFLVGGYLFTVGVLAQVVAALGGAESFQAKALFVLVGVAILGVLLSSNLLRRRIERFVSRHFRRPEHDFRQTWTRFTRNVSCVLDENAMCEAAAKLLSETFNVLSVSIWTVSEQNRQLELAASTANLPESRSEMPAEFAAPHPLLHALSVQGGPFDLEQVEAPWGAVLRSVCASQFEKGGRRIGLPLMAGERCLGLVILADRVEGLAYSHEEFDLLTCMADQLAVGLLNLRLTGELMRGKELQAFQAMSTFFVHDLKNAASSLGLMLRNLPVHFDDPAFRQDALRGITKTVNHINHLVERLSSIRQKVALSTSECDLAQLVRETIESLPASATLEMVQELHRPLEIVADREQLQSVITNLLLNARDAAGAGGKIWVQTTRAGECAVLSVADNGCGMSLAFLRESLFRPFQTTKKTGLGIGMFQARMVVDAHRGSIQVESEPGRGTTFRVSLPLKMSV